jgi:hypothetical protein
MHWVPSSMWIMSKHFQFVPCYNSSLMSMNKLRPTKLSTHTQFLLTIAKLTIHPPSSFACVYHGPISRSLGMLEPFLDCGNININLSILPSLVLLIPMTQNYPLWCNIFKGGNKGALKGRYYLIQKTSKQSWNKNK